MRLKIIILISIIFLSFAQPSLAVEIPENFEQAKIVIINIIEKIPAEVSGIWRQTALPVWKKLAQKTNDIVGPIIQNLLNKLHLIVEKRKPIIREPNFI